MTPDVTAAASAYARGSEVPFGKDGDGMAAADSSSDEEQVAEDTAPFENFDIEVDGTWNTKAFRGLDSTLKKPTGHLGVSK